MLIDGVPNFTHLMTHTMHPSQNLTQLKELAIKELTNLTQELPALKLISGPAQSNTQMII